MRFTGKNIVIQGGTSGIGFAATRGVIDEGATVCIASKQLERLEQAHDLPIGTLADKNLIGARARFEVCLWGTLAAVKHGEWFQADIDVC